MKLIAKKDFINVPSLGVVLTEETPGFVNSNHIHTGHRFEIGRSEKFKELKQDEQDLITRLISSESVVVDNDANKTIIAKIDAEAKAAEAKTKVASNRPAPDGKL